MVLRLTQKGPVLFVQERIGKEGQPFDIYKFRSMKLDSEIDGKPRLARNNDDRLTKAGRFLRIHHLDELPQLWNVLKGDMSFVGQDQNENITSTRYWSIIQGTWNSIRFVRDLHRMPPFTTATQIRWTRCYDDWIWIWTIWNINPFGQTWASWFRRSKE